MATLHELIAENRDAIVQRFVAVAGVALAPPGSSRAVIIDHIPEFLDALVTAMAAAPPMGPRSSLAVMRAPARVHGLQRLVHGFALDVVVREYSALRHVILDLAATENILITTHEYDVFAQAIASGVLAAVVQYTDERTREVELEQRRLHTILSILPVGVFVHDAGGAVLEVNQAALAIWGGPPAAVLPSDDGPVARALFAGEAVHDLELEIQTLDSGAHKTLLISSAPVIDEQGNRTGAVTVCVDVTSRARRMTETTEALRARDEVVNIVSHDLRNPLGAIRLSAQRLLRMAQTESGPLSPEDIVPTVQNITRSSDRMERLLTDLLDVARIEGGRFSIAPASFTLLPAVTEAIDLIRPLAEVKHIVIDVRDVAEVTGAILADRDRLLQVLSNLLGNAIKFTPDGGVITIRAQEQADEIEVSVSDTGPGVPESLQAKIWDRFFTTQAERRVGTGLGLPIVKGIVEEHGGRVWLDSQPGLGASFHFTLPRAGRARGSQPA